MPLQELDKYVLCSTDIANSDIVDLCICIVHDAAIGALLR